MTKRGRKEEELFWNSQKKRADSVVDAIGKTAERVFELHEIFPSDTNEKAWQERKEQLNKKTRQKRSAKAAGFLSGQGQGTKLKMGKKWACSDARKTNTISDMYNVHKIWSNPEGPQLASFIHGST